MAKPETRNDRVRAAHEKLRPAVAEVASGDDWKRILEPNSGGPPSSAATSFGGPASPGISKVDRPLVSENMSACGSS